MLEHTGMGPVLLASLAPLLCDRRRAPLLPLPLLCCCAGERLRSGIPTDANGSYLPAALLLCVLRPIIVRSSIVVKSADVLGVWEVQLGALPP